MFVQLAFLPTSLSLQPNVTVELKISITPSGILIKVKLNYLGGLKCLGIWRDGSIVKRTCRFRS